MTIDQYIANITNRYRMNNATEHTFRGDLQQLIETIVPDVRATKASTPIAVIPVRFYWVLLCIVIAQPKKL